MLSQEIYDSWNAKTLADLEQFLSQVAGPKIPTNVRSSTFKATVLKKIEKRRAAERRKSIELDYELFGHDQENPEGRCSCCSKGRNNFKGGKTFECKSLAMFEAITMAGKDRFTKLISSAKALIQKLSYWESIKPGTDGLSVIGGYIWLLSYTCQHLIDSPGGKEEFRMQSHITEVKELYQVIAQGGELFLDMADSFHDNLYNMRIDGLLVLKKLNKRWKVSEDRNPLHIRRETLRLIPRPRKRLGAGLDSPIDTEDDDDVFSVKWSPLIVFVRFTNEKKKKPFARLHPQDRVTIFRKYMKFTLNKVEMAAEDLTSIANSLQHIEIPVEPKLTLSAREITAAMLEFSKSKVCPKALDEAEQKRMVILLNEFWYSLDVLYENVFVLLRLVQETRDIIRTCYVYADLFYKWYMPSYDSFMSANKRRQSERGSTVANAKEFLNKLSQSDKKLSETTSILSLMDFSSSIYQGVVQEMPLQCDDMVLSLRTNDQDFGTDEPMGLVSGIVDKRKSGLFDMKK